MKSISIITFLTISTLIGKNISAQNLKITDILSTKVVEDKETSIRKSYWTTGMEGLIFSTSYFERPGRAKALTPLRFTAVFHTGVRYHNDFNANVGFMTGIGIKNIGFIEKYSINDSTVKRRIYSLSVPLALKLGQIYDDQYFIVGGALDFAFHYKEKGYINRNQKTKVSEWFSNRTPMFLPNVFVGYKFSFGMYITYHYYPTNFLNQNYTDKDNNKIYSGYNANLMYLTIGFNVRKFPKYG